MPDNHDVVAALPTASNADKELLRGLIVTRIPYVVQSAAEAQDLVAVDPDLGGVIQLIELFGLSYVYDSTDTTTAHDGVSCLVSNDGKRYKLASNADVLCYSVLDYTGTPPGSPGIGDAYLTTASPTGAWAGEGKKIAVYTARGWEFIVPAIGRLIYVEDDDAYYRKKADGSLSLGFGANAVTSGSVAPSALIGGGARVLWIVENQTTTAPPGTVTNGVAYIIGASATGAWSGHDGKIAHGEFGAWVIYTPAAGWRAYDKAQASAYSFNGSGWITDSGKMKCTQYAFTSSGTFSKSSRSVLLEILVIGGSGAMYSSGALTHGGTSSFGAYASATGSTTANPSVAGTGTGTGGVGLTGQSVAAIEALPGFPFGSYGRSPYNGGYANPAAGAGAWSGVLLSSGVSSSVTVTIGAGGTASAGVAGNPGIVVIREWELI